MIKSAKDTQEEEDNEEELLLKKEGSSSQGTYWHTIIVGAALMYV